jgi:hypothetical protein
MLTLSLIALLAHLQLASPCGIAPVAANATCCQCAGFSGSGFPCHWCPGVPAGSPTGCHYHGSAQYGCAGFVAKRADCPSACATLSPTASPSPTPIPSGFTASASASPAPLPSPIPLRPFSKKGVGYYGGNCSDFGEGGLSSISWFYDWGHDQASMARSGCASRQPDHNVLGVEYVPQIWGKYALKNITQMNTTFISGARYIFSFNEPDHSGSSYLPPLEGAQRWPDMVQLAQAFNLTLVAPCVSNYASGQWWLSAWHSGCRNLTGQPCFFQHSCLHTYFDPSDTASLFSSLARMHADYQAPIWLNEFACPPYKNCTASNQMLFMQSVVPRLEALPYLYRYAWFEARHAGGPEGAPESLLVTPADSPPQVQLTPLGQWYNSFH